MKTNFIIPLHNYSDQLEKSLLSILNQTVKDFDVLIIDDASTDSSLEVAKQLKEKYSNYRIDVFHLSDNVGLTKVRDLGARLVTGDYIVYLDPDGDYIDPDFLECLIPVMDENPEIAFCYPDTRYYWADGRIHDFHQQEYNFYDLVMKGNFISYCCPIRRTHYFAVGGFDTSNWSYQEDYQFWEILGRKGYYGKHYPKKLFNYFCHDDSAIHSGFTAEAALLFKAYFIKQMPEIYPSEFQSQADEILKGVPENFMSLPKNKQTWWEERKKNGK